MEILKKYKDVIIVFLFVLLVILHFLPSTLGFLIIKISFTLVLLAAVAFSQLGKIDQFLNRHLPQREEENAKHDLRISEGDKPEETTIDPEEMFSKYISHFCQMVKKSTGVDSIFIYYHNEFKHHFKLDHHHSHHKPEVLNLTTYIEDDSGLFHIIKKSKSILVENNVEISPKTVPYYSSHITDEGSIALIPFYFDKIFAGIIALDSSQPNHFTDKIKELLRHFAEQFQVQFIVSNQLFEYIEKNKLEKGYIEIANTFNKTVGTDEILNKSQSFIRELFTFDRAMIVLGEDMETHEEGTGFIHSILGINGGFNENFRFNLKDGLIGWSMLQNQPIKIVDTYKRPKKVFRFFENEPNQLATRSILISPIATENETFGALILESQKPYCYGDLEKTMLTFLAKQMAYSIQRSKIHDQLMKQQTKHFDLQIWNYNSFQERLQEEISRSQRFQKCFSVVLFRIDFISKINDYQQLENTKLLKKIIQFIQAESRKIDWIGYYDENEIVILLLETDHEGAAIYTKRILQNIYKRRFEEEFANLDLKIYASGSTFPTFANSFTSILDQLRSGLDIANQEAPFSFYIPSSTE
ncbi:MAG: hypothetical protein Kow00108_04230 [Calditrichia bacterium]